MNGDGGIGIEQFAVFLVGVGMIGVGALVLAGTLSTNALLNLGGSVVVALLAFSLGRFSFDTDRA